jgi:hypothetical protein
MENVQMAMGSHSREADAGAAPAHELTGDPMTVVSDSAAASLCDSASENPAEITETFVETELPRGPSDRQPRRRHLVRGWTRGLLAVATSQYIVVTALIVLSAWMVSRHASHILNEKFAAITHALKRF